MNLGVTHVEDATCAVVTFPAEVDMSNGADLLDQALLELESRPAALLIDLGRCTFCDSSGLNVILRAHMHARAAGVPMRLVLPETGIVRRVCDISGITSRIAHSTSRFAARSVLAIPPADLRPAPRR